MDKTQERRLVSALVESESGALFLNLCFYSPGFRTPPASSIGTRPDGTLSVEALF